MSANKSSGEVVSANKHDALYVNPEDVPRIAAVSQQFAALWDGAPEIEGHDLVETSDMVGVPHLITAISVRTGTYRDKSGTAAQYVSVEATVGGPDLIARAIERERMTEKQVKMFSPYEQVVYNDGGTGIMRQCIAFLHNAGKIVVPDGPNDGAAGESRWDTHRTTWANLTGDGAPFTDDTDARFELASGLRCPRGLRASTFDSPYGPATTHYLG